MSMRKKGGSIIDYDDYDDYDEETGCFIGAKQQRIRQANIISTVSIFCGIILAIMVVVGIIRGSIFNYQFKADAVYLHSVESATGGSESIPLPHVRKDGLDGVKVTLNDECNSMTVGAGNIKGYTRISGQLVATGYEQYDQSINIGFEEKDEYGRTVFVPIIQNWSFTSQPVVEFDVPLKGRKDLDMVIYGNEDGTVRTGVPYIPGSQPPPYYVDIVFNRVFLSRDEASPKENFHSIDRLPLNFLGAKATKYGNNPLDEQAIDVKTEPMGSNVKINTDGYFQYYEEIVPDMEITLPEEIGFVEIEGLETVYTTDFDPGRIRLSNIKPIQGEEAVVYIPKGAKLQSGYVTNDDYIITQYVQRTSGFQALFANIKKHLSTVIIVAVGILMLIIGHYGSDFAELEHTIALIVSAGLSVLGLLFFHWSNGKLFLWSFPSILLVVVSFLLLAIALSIICYLLIFSITSGEPFYLCSIFGQIVILSCIGLAILTALLTVIYIVAICFALYLFLRLASLRG